MEITPEQIEAGKLVVRTIPALIAGFAALRKICLLAGQIGGRESQEYQDAQDVAQQSLGHGFEPSGVTGSSNERSRSARDDR